MSTAFNASAWRRLRLIHAGSSDGGALATAAENTSGGEGKKCTCLLANGRSGCAFAIIENRRVRDA